jgi:hypothetical protein
MENSPGSATVGEGDTAATTVLPSNPSVPLKVIPAHVESHVPLLLQAFSLKPNGDGIFVGEDVKAGDFIYSVRNSTLNIVSASYIRF